MTINCKFPSPSEVSPLILLWFLVFPFALPCLLKLFTFVAPAGTTVFCIFFVLQCVFLRKLFGSRQRNVQLFCNCNQFVFTRWSETTAGYPGKYLVTNRKDRVFPASLPVNKLKLLKLIPHFNMTYSAYTVISFCVEHGRYK